MKTKREVLKVIAKQGSCVGIICHDCPYYYRRTCPDFITANTVLQMFPEKKNSVLIDFGTKIKFDDGSIAKIESTTAGPELFLQTINGCTFRPLSYLLGRTWEVIKE